jgi:hypothetical protein
LKRSGYFLGTFVLCEFIVFGTMAFYGNTYNSCTNPPLQPHDIRVVNPSDHPIYKCMISYLPKGEANSLLRIATEKPFYDNILQINNRFAFLGESAFPLEKRFKSTIDNAYGRVIDSHDFYRGDSYLPKNASFFGNFSVGFFLNSDPRKIFLKEECVPLAEGYNYFLHINKEAIPIAYTLNNIIVASDEQQIKTLISEDLRKAVYVDLNAGLLPQGKVEEDYLSHFLNLQKINHISQVHYINVNHINIHIKVKVPSMLVFTEVWFPGWKAIVNGKESKIYRVNYCQRGIWLEKGEHHVQMIFSPFSWRIGSAISVITLSIIICIVIFIVLNKLYIWLLRISVN